MNTVNTKSDTLISGTSSADSIQNASGAVNVTLEGLAGNDTLKNWGASASINAGAGNDYIYNDAAKSIILGGKGNDSVTNWGDNVTINGGADADSLINGADKVIIFADTGADTVINQGNDVSISAVSGNNFFANIGASVTIAGGTDSDTLNNQGSNVSIDSGAGNDSIQNIGSTVKISLADGDDKINNFASSVTISGGKGSDSIGNWSGSNKVSISAGAGDDSIYNNGGNKVTINGDSGNDSIYNFYATVKINGGSDNDYIYNAASSVTINGSSGKDTVDNRSNKVSVNGGSGDDSLTNEGAKATILGGDGNDTITNKTALYATDEGGTRTVSPDNVSINGGKGNDLLINTGGANVRLGGGKLVSLNGGEGNDTLTGSTNAEVFVYDSGNDVITNYSGEDTVKIAAGSIDSYYTDNADLIFMIGDGSLTLKDMQGRYITITDSSGNTTTQLYGSTGYSAQDAIKNLVQAWNKTFLSKTDKLDESIKLSTNFNGIQDAIDQMVADCKAAGDADTFLRKYCGIILDNADTGAITGWDAGGSSIKTGDNIVGETLSSLQKVPDYSDTTFTARNLRINIASTGSSLNADGKKTFDGLYSWWADEALKLVEESYGVSFSNGDSIRVEMVPSASYAGNTSSNGVVKLNQSGIKFDSDDDYNGNGIDRTIAHEFTHVAQNLFMGYFPQFLEEGLADLTQGIDDSGKRQWIESLAANADSLATYLDLDASGTGNIPYYAAGYMFYRYLTRQAAVNFNDSADYAWKDNILISGTEDADLLTGSGTNSTLAAGAGNDTLTAYGDNMNLLGENGNDRIFNGGSNVTITGGAGNDSITNSGANVLFTYAYGDGNDSIIGFDATSTLQIAAKDFTTAKSNGNVIVTIGDNKVTLRAAADLSTLNILRAKDDSTVIYDNNSAAKVTLASGIEVGDASSRTAAIRIVGNTFDNSIFGGSSKDTLYGKNGNDYIVGNAGSDKLYGENGDDTLWGGSGNDSLKGGEGADLFIYSGGKDVIVDYATGDKISLGAAVKNASLSGSDAVLIIGSGKLTVKNRKELTLIDSDGNELNTIIGSSIFTDDSAAKVTLGSGIEVGDASSRTAAIRITGNTLDNSIFGGSSKDTLYGKDGNDYIVGNAGSDKLYGENGEDTLWGGSGNDTLKGGEGADLFIYSGGKDIIVDYATGDKISLGAAVDNASLSGSDAVLIIGSGKLTVKNRKELTLIDSDGNELNTIIGSSIFTDDSAAKVTLGSGIEVGDASSRTAAIRITGNTFDNSIFGGSSKDTLYGKDGNDYIVGNAGSDKLYGENGNDTLWGGSGNDTLKGGAGADLFIYNSGEGKDIITDFSNDDLLQITGTFSATYNASENTVAFKVDSTANAIKLKNFTATAFNINGYIFNINGYSYGISDNQLVKIK